MTISSWMLVILPSLMLDKYKQHDVVLFLPLYHVKFLSMLEILFVEIMTEVKECKEKKNKR